MHTKNEEKKIPRKVNVICVPKVMPMFILKFSLFKNPLKKIRVDLSFQ
jgi:hypothetical protein